MATVETIREAVSVVVQAVSRAGLLSLILRALAAVCAVSLSYLVVRAVSQNRRLWQQSRAWGYPIRSTLWL